MKSSKSVSYAFLNRETERPACSIGDSISSQAFPLVLKNCRLSVTPGCVWREGGGEPCALFSVRDGHAAPFVFTGCPSSSNCQPFPFTHSSAPGLLSETRALGQQPDGGLVSPCMWGWNRIHLGQADSAKWMKMNFSPLSGSALRVWVSLHFNTGIIHRKGKRDASVIKASRADRNRRSVRGGVKALGKAHKRCSTQSFVSEFDQHLRAKYSVLLRDNDPVSFFQGRFCRLLPFSQNSGQRWCCHDVMSH